MPPDPSWARLPGPWTHHAVSANGIRVHVAEAGPHRGPLVVLLHGFPEFWWAWRHQLPALAALGYRVVAPDLRGYGDSDKPPRGYDLWTLSGDVAGLVGALGERRAHLIGHGWGGAIAWTVAALHPRRVRTCAAIGAAHPLALRAAVLRDPARQGRATARDALLPQVPRWPEHRLRRPETVAAILRTRSGPDWPATPDFADAVEHYGTAARIPGVAHCSHEYHRWAVRSQFRGDGRRFAVAVSRPPAAPALLVRGELDPALLPRTAEASARWAGDRFRVATVAGVGHFPHEEDPDATTAVLAAHLATGG